MNYYIAVAYKLFVITREGGGEKLQEQRTENEPFIFITGMNKVMPPFEQKVKGLNKGDDIDFYIYPQQAYGVYDKQLIFDVPVEKCLDENGMLNHDIFFVGNIVPMTNTQGEEFWATILEVGKQNIKVDLNHPRAGMTLHFIGNIIEKRPAEQDEIDLFKSACAGCGGGCNGGCAGGGCNSQGCDGECNRGCQGGCQ